MYGIALKMLLGDRAKYLGLVFGISFATLLMAQQMSIFVGLMIRTTSQILDVQEADIWVMDPRVSYVDEVEPLSDTAVNRVRGVQGVDWALPLYKGAATARSPEGLLQQVILMGIDDATLTGAPRKMVMGRWEDLRFPDSIVIDRAGFEFNWPGQPLQLGKVVELNDHRAVIVGISEASAPFTTFPVVHTRYSNAVKYIAQQRRQLSFVVVKAKEGLAPTELCQRIEAATGLKAYTWDQFAWKTVGYFMKRTGIPVNFGITVVLGFIVGAAIAGQTFYLFVIENMRQFGALKAIGVSNGRITAMVLLQAGVVASLGYGIGIGLAATFFVVTRNATPLRGFFMPWQIMLITATAVAAIITLAALVSIRKVLRIDPALVFRN